MKYIIEEIFVRSYTCSCASDKIVWQEKFYIGPFYIIIKKLSQPNKLNY
jgi:hypothetical protein